MKSYRYKQARNKFYDKSSGKFQTITSERRSSSTGRTHSNHISLKFDFAPKKGQIIRSQFE